MSTSATTQPLAIDGGTPVFESPVPFMSLGLTREDIAAANEVLESGMLRAASKCAALEERFAAQTDAKHGLTCANGWRRTRRSCSRWRCRSTRGRARHRPA